jgi:hypothetical protein
MASITRESNGRKTIQFVGTDRKRHSLRLGKGRFEEALLPPALIGWACRVPPPVSNYVIGKFARTEVELRLLGSSRAPQDAIRGSDKTSGSSCGPRIAWRPF